MYVIVLLRKYPLLTITKWRKVKTLKTLSTFLADRTNGSAIAILLRLSVCLSVVCDVMYCG